MKEKRKEKGMFISTFEFAEPSAGWLSAIICSIYKSLEFILGADKEVDLFPNDLIDTFRKKAPNFQFLCFIDEFALRSLTFSIIARFKRAF